ncbi:MAG: hypothetical protein JJ895_12720 [Balneolaceae bacterium]|nr:hypothetical protein [Balneolaceae bacterium]
MQKTINQITDNLAGLVTSDKPFYTPKELLRAKIPSFVVERIRMSLEDKVREELGDLDSQWFDESSKLVEESWKDFKNAAVSSSHIPKEKLYKLLTNVVSDIVHVFIEPRKNMANYIFREDEELTFDQVQQRCSRLTVYKHFGTAIPLYMKKRELKTLTKERCKFLIQKIDAKLVAAYTAEDWAQKLEQLFVLFGGKVEPKLLAIFFEDKGLPAMAKKFTSKRKLVNKTDFIYIISAKEIDATEPDERKSKEQSLIESFFGEYSNEPVNTNLLDDSIAGQYIEGSLSDDEMNELLQDIAADGVVEVDTEHVASLNELFQSEIESEEDEASETSEEIAEKIKSQKVDDQEDIKEFRENLISILDQAKHSFEDVSGEGEATSSPKTDTPKLKIQLDESPEDEPDAAENTANDIVEDDVAVDDRPMWAQFLNDDQMDVIMGGKRSDQRSEEEKDNESISLDEEYDDLEIIEDLNDDLIDEETSNSDSIKNSEVAFLLDLLSDRLEEFEKEIFNSSKAEMEEALQSLSEFENWKKASAYIQTKIFKKNDVDLLSGATVDFTDRMHRYFNERTHS